MLADVDREIVEISDDFDHWIVPHYPTSSSMKPWKNIRIAGMMVENSKNMLDLLGEQRFDGEVTT